MMHLCPFWYDTLGLVRVPGDFLIGIALPSHLPREPSRLTKGNLVFDKTKAKAETFISDRVTAPVRTSMMISIAAFILAGIALIFVVKVK